MRGLHPHIFRTTTLPFCNVIPEADALRKRLLGLVEIRIEVVYMQIDPLNLVLDLVSTVLFKLLLVGRTAVEDHRRSRDHRNAPRGL